jgi:hypothetical protein
MRIWLFLVALGAAFPTFAQITTAQNKGKAILFHIGLGLQKPGSDLSIRFGNNMNVGGSLDWLTEQQNWIFGIEGYYLFGTEVKENVLQKLQNSDGFIIGNNGELADIQLRERGFYIGGHIGKLFSLSAVNPRSGIRATLGAGLLQHKIRIQDDPLVATPQLSEDKKKGYDRLSNGLAINEFVGYQLLTTNKRVNFTIGFEFTQGFTQNRRDFNYDTRIKDARQRLDLLWGLRANWIIPFYGGKGAAEIYY